jgi:hypothetical protein
VVALINLLSVALVGIREQPELKFLLLADLECYFLYCGNALGIEVNGDFYTTEFQCVTMVCSSGL